MSTTNYNKVEKEKIRLSEENLKRVAGELGVSVETIKELPKDLIGNGHHNQQAENANFVVHPAPDKIITLLESAITSLQAENAYLRSTNELLINKIVNKL